MILIEGNWEEVNDLNMAINIVGGYYNSDLADEIARLAPIHSDEEYYQLLDKIDNLEKENEKLQDENNFLDLENDKLREKLNSWRMNYMKVNRTNTKENEVMMVVESINTYKKVLEDTEVNVCTGMTESEKKAYKLGIYNSFAVINDFLDQNLNEDVPHYTVLLRDDIKSEEFTIDDFKKWTESREHGLV